MTRPSTLPSLVALMIFGSFATPATAQNTGDFNGDGKADLAVGVPYENIGAKISAGAVHVLYGSASNLTAAGSQIWHQNSSSVLDASEIDDRFGAALAVGDFNNDGFDDLAIGIPGEDIGFLYDAGAVAVLYGTANGLRSTRNQFWHQDSAGIKDLSEEGDHLGAALAAGDFNKDGYADLAIGAPGEDIGEAIDAGMLHVIYGSATGLHKRFNQAWWQGANGALDAPDSGDLFGSALVAADFTGDRFADLAVGVPGQMVNGFGEAGAVHIFKGSISRLTALGNSVWTQDALGLDPSELCDWFGFSLAAGDFNKDRKADLVVGAHLEDIGEFIDAGAVHVLYSNAAGPAVANSQFWHQNLEGMPDPAEERDWFGFAITAADFNRDGYADLAIGSPFESIDEHVETGAVTILNGSVNRLTTTGATFWHQDSSDLPGDNNQWDNFGSSLTAGDFNGDSRPDLVIGTPGDDHSGVIDAGSITVLFSKVGGLTAAGCQCWHQDIPGVADLCEPGDYFGHSIGR